MHPASPAAVSRGPRITFAQLALFSPSHYRPHMFDQDSANLVRPYLSPGERILWTGRPKQGLVFRGKDALLIPFSLLWGGFAIFWNFEVWTFPETGSEIDWFMRLWGLPFLAAGLYFIVGRFLHDAMIRHRLYYAVTDRRVLIMRGVANLTARDIAALPMLQVSEHRDGTGTIVLDSDEVGYSMFYGMRGFGDWTLSRNANAQLFRIENAHRVYELIHSQVQA